ncbi:MULTISPECIES: NAD(P)/FAD-dependent oxidoreductase [unclassified Streptomyces]|uniref:NAD(P)/FAD-dependent oxidoreductase n=1 Tax=unclassified Streptomyces TaxID=2593676 RepID=UPI000F70BE91|nr:MULTISPECIES: NAD(P)/FAD-dependent oxidoreductase [unclassified Streptomyces]AZM64122.1 FAD/NAD(P)-binding oxidoreductase [Streptomyces sp. WAC 01438]RSM87341.1 FAD/NAD(P)-binding oxidoreductase [Streptomyces sp. WAC 01420]
MSEPDLLVVGAGPAGLAATATALAGGLRVVLVDSGTAVGGQYWRHPPERARAALPTDDLHHRLREYRALNEALTAGRAAGRLELLLEHHVWSAVREGDGFAVHAADRRQAPRETAGVLRAPRLLVATGAYDRHLPFPGWDLPGVLSVGGLQALLKGGGVTAGSRVALGGTGPFLLPVAAALAARGAKVVAVCEAARPSAWLRHPGPLLRTPRTWAEAAGYATALARRRVPFHPRTAITEARGDGRVTSVRISSLRPDGGPRPGTERHLQVDTVGVGWGFAPQLDLLVPLGCALTGSPDGNAVVAVDRGQRTTVPGVYAAGETCGVGGAALAANEGRLAAASVLADCGAGSVPSGRHLTAVRSAVARHRAFARALARVHPLPAAWPAWLTDETVVCRCEEVTAGTIRTACAEDAAPDHRQVKQLTRAGMGWCQGRMCGPAVHCLTAARRAYEPAERLVATPVTLGALADLDP